MKRFFLFALVGFLMLGCSQKEIVFSQESLCDTPIVKISVQHISKNGDGTITTQEFEKLFKEITQGTNCINLVSNTASSDYVANIDFEVKTQNQENKVLLTKETQETLTATVTLNLGNDDELRKEVGQSSISTKKKKVIGLGEKTQITKEDEEKALRNSLLVALKNFITSLLSKDEEDQEI